ncbi:MAG: hypothetical protein ACQESJ_08655 [Bacteroidota bacterium]
MKGQFEFGDLKFDPSETIKVAGEAKKGAYAFEEFMSDEAGEFLKLISDEEKTA